MEFIDGVNELIFCPQYQSLQSPEYTKQMCLNSFCFSDKEMLCMYQLLYSPKGLFNMPVLLCLSALKPAALIVAVGCAALPYSA